MLAICPRWARELSAVSLGVQRTALCLLCLLQTWSQRTAVVLDTLKRWEIGRFEHVAVTVGVLEAQCPLDSKTQVRAGIGAGSAALEESPNGSPHSPSPGSPAPIRPAQQCLTSPLLVCYPWSAKKHSFVHGANLRSQVRCCSQICWRQMVAGICWTLRLCGTKRGGSKHTSGLSIQS